MCILSERAYTYIHIQDTHTYTRYIYVYIWGHQCPTTGGISLSVLPWALPKGYWATSPSHRGAVLHHPMGGNMALQVQFMHHWRLKPSFKTQGG